VISGSSGIADITAVCLEIIELPGAGSSSTATNTGGIKRFSIFMLPSEALLQQQYLV
jgi:hypothetical protein